MKSDSIRTTRTRELPRTTQLPFYQYYIYAKSDGKRLMTSAVAITPEISPVTSRPSSTQKFSRYKQAGGGAFIPVTLLVEGPQPYKEFVLERIRFTLPECENVGDMHVECLK